MKSNDIMYRTIFLLSDNMHQSTSQIAKPGTSPSKKTFGSYSNVSDKEYHSEAPNSVFCGAGNSFILSLPESKSTNSKLISPFSPVELSETNDFASKKDLLVNQTNTISSNLGQRVSCSENGDGVHVSVRVGPLNNNGNKERPFTCEDCGKTFLLKHHLVTHARVHSGERPHVCAHCGKTFAHKHCLSTHLLLHTSQRPFTCPECNKSFTLKHHLVTHARVHNRDRPYVCQECGRTFPQKRHLVTHTKFHSGERPYVCSDCGESFAQEEHLILHSRFHGETRPYHCQDCGLTFTRKFELVDHSRIHGRVPFSCAACGKEFLQKRSFQAHLRLHNTLEGAKHAYCCIHCGETFHTKDALEAHACEEKGKSFICRECGNIFFSREALSLHARLHASGRNLVPDLCSLAAAFQQQQQSSLPSLYCSSAQEDTSPQLPDRISNLQAGVSPPSQEESVARLRALALSKSTIPKTLPMTLKPKPHVCPGCGRAFSQKHGLIQHKKRYTNGGCDLRRFACEKCGKAFLQKNHLVLHERQHLAPQQRNSGSQARTKTGAQLEGAVTEFVQTPPSPNQEILDF